MTNNSLIKIYNYVKRKLVYQPPDAAKPFVLKEVEQDATRTPCMDGLRTPLEEIELLLRYARRLETAMGEAIQVLRHGNLAEKLAELRTETDNLNTQYQELSPIMLAYRAGQEKSSNLVVSASLEENLQTVKKLYDLPRNKDIVIRKFSIPAEPAVKAMLVFMDGLCDKKIINAAILQPLMLFSTARMEIADGDLARVITEDFLPSNQVKQETDFRTVTEGINGGDTALFVEGMAVAMLVETKGWEHRTVDRPNVEQTARGSQEAFGEILRVNTALIRKRLKANDLVTEMFTIGRRSRTNTAIMYVKSIANLELVEEVRRRIAAIDTDYLADVAMLETFIEDHPGVPFPQALTTERPDRVSAHMAEGRVAILCDGSPFVLVVPISMFSLFHAGDDFNLRFPITTFVRLIRLFGALFSMTLPGIYLAFTTFHQEALPTELALAIAGAREKIPFPILLEIILMELSFEFIREAGFRIPGALGSTIGIVGAVVLGQTAVAANLVSPIMVVIIAMSGLASFTVPDFILGFGARLLRFVFILLGAIAGFVGIADGFLLLTGILCSMKSFGMPYLSPVSPKTGFGLDVIVRGLAYRQENRPDALNTQDQQRQPSIIRKWTKKPPKG